VETRADLDSEGPNGFGHRSGALDRTGGAIEQRTEHAYLVPHREALALEARQSRMAEPTPAADRTPAADSRVGATGWHD
jgi:hypothetical protein